MARRWNPGTGTAFSVELNENRQDGSYRARAFSFVDFTPLAAGGPSDVYLPQTIINPDGSPGGFARVVA